MLVVLSLWDIRPLYTDARHGQGRLQTWALPAGQKAILEEIRRLQDATASMKDSISEMTVGTKKIEQSGVQLKNLAVGIPTAIRQVADEVDLFKV